MSGQKRPFDYQTGDDNGPPAKKRKQPLQPKLRRPSQAPNLRSVIERQKRDQAPDLRSVIERQKRDRAPDLRSVIEKQKSNHDLPSKRKLVERENITAFKDSPLQKKPKLRQRVPPPPRTQLQHSGTRLDKGKGKLGAQGKLRAQGKHKSFQKQAESTSVLPLHAQGTSRHVHSRVNCHSAPNMLHKLASDSIGNQLNYMCSDQFLQFIYSAEECSDEDKVILFIRILQTLLEQESHHIRKTVPDILCELLKNGTLFLPCLSSILCKMPLESRPNTRIKCISFLGDIHLLFWKMLERCPPLLSCRQLPIDTLAGSTRQLADQEIRFQEINEKVQQLVKKRDSIRSEHYQLKTESSKGEDDAALPTPEDLRMKELPVDLRPNKVQGSYSTVQEYLTLQYRLLREDFINPLRTSLNKLQDSDEDCQEVKVYENVQFIRETYTQGGITFKVSFQAPDQRCVNWEHSKRFTYGSLLCLSHDKFQTVIFATVAERDVQELKRGVVTIKVENGIDGLSLSPRTVYRMAESPGYYGAYAPVLKHLRNINPEQLPFSKYLVECSCEVNMPVYLQNIEEVNNKLFDFTGVICNCNPTECIHKNIDVLNAQTWSELDAALLDPSQKKALRTALTNELAMIQGPPGTGKTYIGLKVIETLLLNQHLYTSDCKKPIIVVCYTNHALDQFLEGVIEIQAGIQHKCENVIVRVGGRCRSEKVKDYNIRCHLQLACRELGLRNYTINRLKQKREALDELLEGKYNPLNCCTYAYFFGQQFMEICEVHFLDDTTSFASWFFPEKAQRYYGTKKQLQAYSYHQAMEDDRKITESEEDDTMLLFRILGEEGIKKIVLNFKSVVALSPGRAHSLCTSPSGIEELKQSSHVCLQLFKFCLEKSKPILANTFTLEREHFEKEREMIMVKCLKKADIIGLTTTGAAKHHAILSQIGAKIVIMEEAAEVLEGHVLATLTQHTQHLILIGDHKQLRPKTNDYILARNYKLDVSLFERLINNKFPCVTLEVQHRMRPELSEIVSSKFYDGILKDDPLTREYGNIKGLKQNIYFVDHTECETPNEELKSPANDHEATFLAHLCQYLLQQGYKPEQITVITPYTGQMFNLRRTFRELGIENVHITPIDSYQGEENDIILLSFVRSKKIGFVRDANRVCVALSRAKQGLYCIGNFSQLFQHSSELWESIICTLKDKKLIGKSLALQCTRHENITEVSSAEDFKLLDGGCTKPCEQCLPCDHVCPSKCHPSDERHKRPCREPCPKYLCPSGHRCRRLCYEFCGNCEELVDKVIPKCQHVQKVPCHLDPTQFVCQERCSKPLPCGHPCTNLCGEVCTTECSVLVKRTWLCGHEAQTECYITEQKYARICEVSCDAILKCGHSCRGTCGKCRQGRLHVPCQEECARLLSCGHVCSSKCAMNCPPCRKECIYSCPHGPCGKKCTVPCRECTHRCKWTCQHLKCTRNCGELCDRERCDEPCPKSLSCGHPCLGLCGEPCLSVCRECNKEKWDENVPPLFGTEEEPDARFIQLSDCQHIFEVSGMDQWMDGKDQPEEEHKIQWKCCILCKQPITKTFRYANIAKQMIKDMNEVKCRKWYILQETERDQIRGDLLRMASTTPVLASTRSKYNSDITTFSDVFLLQDHLIFTAAQKAGAAHTDLETSPFTGPYLGTACMEIIMLAEQSTLLKAQIRDFIVWLKLARTRGNLTDQMQHDIIAEQKRISLLTQIYSIQRRVVHDKISLNPEDKSFLETTLELHKAYGTKVTELTDDVYESKQYELKMLTRRYEQLQRLSEEEKDMIIKAISSKPGSWYKCPNGHFYGIGACGGAMETSNCPACKAPIGGRRHQLLSDNAHAGEFDGSRHAAWSEAANMANYMFRL